MPGPKIVFTLILLAGAMIAAGCGDGGGGADAGNPRVVATYPESGAIDVRLNPLVEIWFDQAIDEATIDTASIQVAGAVTERIEYEGAEHLVRLYLSELLEPETGYEILVDSTITNMAGDLMTEDRSFDFTTGPLDCDHLDDYLEPNNTIDIAADIDIVKAYPLLSSCGDGHNEYYRFVLSDTALVTARIEYVYSDAAQPTWYISFRRGTDEVYTQLISWFSEGKNLNYGFTFLPGTYYLNTGSGEPSGHVVVYNLILQLSAPCPDDTLEDNDFIDEATPIGPGVTSGLRGCFKDRDCFSIHLGTGQTLTVTADQYPNIGSQVTLEIMGPDGSVLTDGTYQENPAAITWTATQDTSHYISAMYWSSNVRYSIEVEVLSLP